MNTHPAAEIFPLMSDDDYLSLKNDIAANGLAEPITLYSNGSDTQLLDGRNRLRACEELGIQPRTEFYEGDFPAEYVISKNLKRRNLSASQRAALAYTYLDKFGAEAEARRVAALQKYHRDKAAQDQDIYRASLHDEKVGVDAERTKVRDYKAEHDSRSATQAAKLTGASQRYVDDVRNIVRTEPRLYDLICEGKLDIPQAKEVIKLAQPRIEDIVTYLVDSPVLEREESRKIIEKAKRADRTETIVSKTNTIEKLTGEKKYNLIYADPPWEYRNSIISGAAESQYPIMNLESLKELPVKEIASTEGCVLFLWATPPFLPEAIKLIEVWNFTYITHCIWQKSLDYTGGYRGYYFKAHHELLLLATLGNVPPPNPDTIKPSIIYHPRLEHSQKPDRFYEVIEKMYPKFSKIELFARGQREDWDCWGNQIA